MSELVLALAACCVIGGLFVLWRQEVRRRKIIQGAAEHWRREFIDACERSIAASEFSQELFRRMQDESEVVEAASKLLMAADVPKTEEVH